MRIRAARPEQLSSSGEFVRLILMPPTSRRLGSLLDVVGELVRAGVTLRTAKKVVEELASGRTAYVEAPRVANYERLKREFMSQNIATYQMKPRKVDIRALRERMGISQEAFAGRYGLDVSTLRNWEQGRTEPDGPAAVLLQLIDRNPDEVVKLLAS